MGGCTVVAGDPMTSGAWMDAVKDCGAVVNLVGEGIFKRRWSAAFKQLLRDSRIQSTQNIVAAIAKNPTVKTLVNASAIGYYGSTGAEELTEASSAGTDFLAQACVDWEKAAAAAHSVRTVILRVGVVLDPGGGALQKMITPFKMFVGGPIGSGKQYISWVHHQDMVGLILFALDNTQLDGPVNATPRLRDQQTILQCTWPSTAPPEFHAHAGVHAAHRLSDRLRALLPRASG